MKYYFFFFIILSNVVLYSQNTIQKDFIITAKKDTIFAEKIRNGQWFKGKGYIKLIHKNKPNQKLTYAEAYQIHRFKNNGDKEPIVEMVITNQEKDQIEAMQVINKGKFNLYNADFKRWSNRLFVRGKEVFGFTQESELFGNLLQVMLKCKKFNQQFKNENGRNNGDYNIIKMVIFYNRNCS